MRRSPVPATVVLTGALALALGCNEQQSPMAPAGPPGLAYSVDRATGPLFSLGFGNEQYSVIIGSTFENWVTFCRTREENWDDWTILTVTRPDGSLKQT